MRVISPLHVNVEAFHMNGTQHARISDFEDLKTATTILGLCNCFLKRLMPY